MKIIREKIYTILRWSEKWTKIDMVYVADSFSWMTLGSASTALASFLLAVAFANLVPKETYGTYKYILSIAGILTIPTLVGMQTAITRAVARGFEGSFLPALKTKIKWGILSIITSIGLGIYHYFQGNNILATSFLLISFFLPFYESLNLYNSYLQGKKLFKKSSQYVAAVQILFVLVMASTLFISESIFFILLAYFATYTLLRLFFLKKTLKNFVPNKNEDPKTISYGKHLSFIGIFGKLIENLDKLLLFHYLGPASVALFMFAIMPIDQIGFLLQPLFVMAFPKFAAKNIDEIKNTLKPIILKFTLLLVPIIALYIFLAPYLFQIFFPQYAEVVIYSQIFALVLLMRPSNLIGTLITAKAQKAKIYISSIAMPLTKTLLMLLLIPSYGIIGAVFALIGTEIARASLAFYFLKRI